MDKDRQYQSHYIYSFNSWINSYLEYFLSLFFLRFFFREDPTFELSAASEEAVFGSSASEEHSDFDVEPEDKVNYIILIDQLVTKNWFQPFYMKREQTRLPLLFLNYKNKF